MYCTRKITDDLYWVGASDRRLALFENIFPIPEGVSFNAYLLLDEKTVLFDTVDNSVGIQFLENVEAVLGERTLDYLIINHMEPDHCSLIVNLLQKYPELQIIGNAKTFPMINQFYDINLEGRQVLIKEGDTFSCGRHTLHFIMAPMVHWPEVMMTYDEMDQTFFSADAFGTFGALAGTIFNDELDFDRDLLDSARRYYTNVVGKYGPQVQNVLKKAAAFDIQYICPLHGPIWRSSLDYILEKYHLWSKYEPEVKGVLIAYASMYGNTENAANVLAVRLADAGVKNISVCDVSQTHVSYLIAEAFKYSHLVLASPTYNGGIYPVMANFLEDMKALNLQGRTAALLENGTWAPSAAKQMAARLGEMKNMTVLEDGLVIKSALKKGQQEAMDKLAKKLAESILRL